MEYIIIFIGSLIGAILGSLLTMILLSLIDKKNDNKNEIIPPITKDNKWKKKASKELDEMLNKIKNE